jgi:dephospho-CoA kinase
VTAGRALRIGLTGPIGCGKSTVAGWLAERGAVVIDADVLARVVTEPGNPATEAILARFGGAFRTRNGGLDRSALAALVFRDEAALRDLEAIVHPAVRPQILARIAAADAAAAPAVVLEAIKLVEGGLAGLCDEVWLVTCPAKAQRRRLRLRGTSSADADRRIATQAGLTERLRPAATRVIDTAGPPEVTRALVEASYDRAFDAAPPAGPGAQAGAASPSS